MRQLLYHDHSRLWLILTRLGGKRNWPLQNIQAHVRRVSPPHESSKVSEGPPGSSEEITLASIREGLLFRNK